MNKIILLFKLYKLYNYTLYIYTGYQIYSYFNKKIIYSENIEDDWILC